MSAEVADTPDLDASAADGADASEEPAHFSADFDEDDANVPDATPGSEIAADLEDLAQLMSSVSKTQEVLAVAQKKAVAEVLAATGDASGSDADLRSVYVSEVDFAVTAEQLQDFFKACGDVERVTLLRDNFTKRPKGCVPPCGRLSSSPCELARVCAWDSVCVGLCGCVRVFV